MALQVAPGAAPVPKGLVAVDDAGMDAKTRLNQFCQRYCLRPVTKNDIVYNSTKFGPNQYQAIVQLNCMDGQEYAGELASNQKDAEKSAAQEAYAAVMASLPQQQMPSKPKKKSGTGEKGSGDDAQNPALTDKVRLNALCMQITKRPLQKGETLYESRALGLGKAPTGYQTTVRLPCLPNEWSEKMFAGQVCTTKQAAEQSAAGIALAAMLVDPVLTELAAKKAPASTEGGDGEGGKKKKGKGWKGWWGPAVTGPDLPREPVAQAVAATVVEWKGNFGWVKPNQPLDHAAAAKREGKVYLHKQDLKNGKETLEEGAAVIVNVYSDATGLGAEEA